MADELAEIDGIKPNVWLEEGDEHEIGSQSRFVIQVLFYGVVVEQLCSKSVYKVKRTFDHYYW